MISQWTAAGSLAVAALLVAWPTRSHRTRRRDVLGIQQPTNRSQARWSYPSLPPQRWVPITTVLAAGVGAVAGGPVAAVIAAAYGGLAARTVQRKRSAAAAASARARQLDHLGGLAADLRAGLPASSLVLPAAANSLRPSLVAAATAAPAGVPLRTESDSIVDGSDLGRRTNPDRITHLTRAAVRLAEQTGAPLAELFERIEADARATDRAAAVAAAQAAGAQATAWLLTGLPLGGIALGYAIGADPLHVLLHTPLGAGCALGAVALQLGGLAWAERLLDVRVGTG